MNVTLIYCLNMGGATRPFLFGVYEMTKYDETQLIQAVRSHAMKHYEKDGWDYLVECWDDGDILDQISAVEQTPSACIKHMHDIVKTMDDYRREVRSQAF